MAVTEELKNQVDKTKFVVLEMKKEGININSVSFHPDGTLSHVNIQVK
jgi:hypothetical protein